MGKRIYLVRHCKAEGQNVEAKLTEEGIHQAKVLVDFFSEIKIDRMITSPFTRAIESILPLSKERGIPIEIDKRLSERILSTENLVDWQEKLKDSFDDLDICYHGGESSREAMNRGMEVIDDLIKSDQENTLITTHGNLMALLLKSVDPSFGFNEWKKLSNPDIYLLEPDISSIKRLWN
ncbi:histidine phosphatase family protein [Paucisalibacillus sp. EB02]|uniref:histidine phosphatase family protein n=1 Tax=Paucisalibacillus sp. EB02 TaxID=1347087 RepID=UPI0004B82D2E|nr:histidine phosphatase family protein [Paucisalibacillus sp. EB02]